MDILKEISKIGELDDKDITLGGTALLMSSIYHPDISLIPYHIHLDQLVVSTEKNHKDMIDAGKNDNNDTRLAALKATFIDTEAYAGDTDSPYDIRNADMIQVIDRHKGLPTTLGLLFIHVSRALRWDVDALSFPANFILRLKIDSDLLIFDPFNECKILQASDLRQLLKTAQGEHAELSSNFYIELTNREILINIFNFLKLKFIEDEDYRDAAKTVEMMMALDPEEYRLLLDAGVLFSRTERPHDALNALQDYISRTPHARERQEAAILIQQIKQSLN